MKTIYCAGALAALAVVSSPLAMADTFVETADAGINEAGAVSLPPGTTEIQGILKAGTLGPFSGSPVDVDVYAFTISQSVPAASVQVTGAFNTNVLLLREGFFGILGNDGGGNDSGFVQFLTPGTYFIAIGQNNIGAYPFTAVAAGDHTWGNDSGFLAGPEANTPIKFIGAQTADPTDTTGNAYTVSLNFGGVPVVVTGIDLSAGKSRKKAKGTGILNFTGRGQVAKVRGSQSTKFSVFVSNTGTNRKVRSKFRGNLSRTDLTVIARRGKTSKNVTAKLRARGHKTAIGTGAIALRYIVTVRRGESGKLSEKLILRTLDLQKKSVRDAAGARVVLR